MSLGGGGQYRLALLHSCTLSPWSLTLGNRIEMGRDISTVSVKRTQRVFLQKSTSSSCGSTDASEQIKSWHLCVSPLGFGFLLRLDPRLGS